MMEELAKLLRARGINFDGTDKRVMCFAHVINICCQHVIETITDATQAESVDDFITEDLSYLPQHQTFEEAAGRDPVAMGRNIVRVFRSSGQRRQEFEQHIRDGNKNNWFESPVREVQLLRDVKTRWDSVYLMLGRLRELQPVRHYHLQFKFCLLTFHAYRGRP